MEGYVIENGKPNFAICARCGATIKHITYFRGKPYGSTCILVVTGHKRDYWITTNNSIDEIATAKREQKRQQAENELQEQIRKNEAKATQIAANAKRDNKWLIDIIRDCPGGFCTDIANILNRRPLTEDEFSENQLWTMARIYAKSHGRRNSKAYQAALDYFWAKL